MPGYLSLFALRALSIVILVEIVNSAPIENMFFVVVWVVGIVCVCDVWVGRCCVCLWRVSVSVFTVRLGTGGKWPLDSNIYVMEQSSFLQILLDNFPPEVGKRAVRSFL